jgi:hypothetical protein
MRRILMLAGILGSIVVPWASATTEVRIVDVVGGVAVGDTGWIQCAGSACIFTGAVGNYEITSDITVQHTVTNPLLDMSYSASNLTNANPGTIIIEAMANGYTLNTPELRFIDNGNSGFTSGTFTDAAYGGNNNNICAAGLSACWNGTTNPASSGTGSALIASGGPFVSPTVWGVDKTAGGNTANPYSLGLTAILSNPTGLSSMSGDAKIDAVPEPASVMLLGGVLLLTVSSIRRRTRRSA